MSNDPWKDIAPPAGLDAVSAKRVDPDVPWGFFWGRATDRKCLFVLSHGADSLAGGQLPNLRGVEITDVQRGTTSEHMLIFKLLEDGHRDIFERLCRDIVASATSARTEKGAVALALARTWRWHHLLRGGADGRLSPEEQKGLAGELRMIEHLLKCLSPRETLDSWRGPLDSPKDFEIGRLCVEVKARRGAATPHIAMSSADQLDTAGVDQLFLSVVEIDQAPADLPDTFTLTALATRVKGQLTTIDAGIEDQFDRLLDAAGFDWDHDYSDSRLIEGASLLFLVSDGFPRLTGSTMPPGISNVRYSVALQDCIPFTVNTDSLFEAIAARRNVG